LARVRVAKITMRPMGHSEASQVKRAINPARNKFAIFQTKDF
jgi:hypothetical protein